MLPSRTSACCSNRSVSSRETFASLFSRSAHKHIVTLSIQVTINLCNPCVHLLFMTDTSNYPGRWGDIHHSTTTQPFGVSSCSLSQCNLFRTYIYFTRTLTYFKPVAECFHQFVMNTVGRVPSRGILGGGSCPPPPPREKKNYRLPEKMQF